MSGTTIEVEFSEVADERSALTTGSLALIEQTFDRSDRQPLDEIRSEIAEKRLGLPTTREYHLMAATGPDRAVLGCITGVYLAGVNAGFVSYLAVRPEFRRHGIGRRLRVRLVEQLQADAMRHGHEGLTWVLGEVRLTSPWLRRLVRNRGAIPFDLNYYHPGVQPPERPIHVLYRQPVADRRIQLPAQLVRRIVFAVYHVGFRVRYPLLHAGFQAMLRELEKRRWVGLHPRYAMPPESESGGATGGAPPLS